MVFTSLASSVSITKVVFIDIGAGLMAKTATVNLGGSTAGMPTCLEVGGQKAATLGWKMVVTLPAADSGIDEVWVGYRDELRGRY